MTLNWERLPSWNDPRLPFVAILTAYLILGITVLGFNRSPEQIVLTVAAACLLDVALHYVLRGGRWLFPLSGLISGLSLSILVNYAHGVWLALIPVFFAIGSKYLFTFNDRHVFNPSLFGVVACLLFADGMFSASPAYQWGGSVAMAAFVVTAALVLFVFRIQRHALIVSFLLFYFAALALRAWLTRWHLPPETLFMGALSSPAFYLFTFFMITDPATSPSKPRAQVLMAFCIVLIDLLLHQYQSLSTLFFAGFIYFAGRWLFLHLRAISLTKTWPRHALLTGGRNVVVLGMLTALGGLGYHQVLGAQAHPDPGFRYQLISSQHSDVTAGPSKILEQLDPRIAHVGKWLLSVGDAVALADVDGDGRVDMFLTYPLKHADDRAALYRNLGDGRFERIAIPDLVPIAADPARYGLPSGAAWFDYDNDGDSDLLLMMSYGKTRLLQNRLREQGSLVFRDVSDALGIDAYTAGVAVNVLDIDRDGRVDIVLCNAMNPRLPDYEPPQRFTPFRLPDAAYPGDRRMFNFMHRTWYDAQNGGGCLVYFNRPERFELADVAALGLGARRWTLAIGSGDLNNDGWTDLYLANDFGPDELLINEQGKRFTAVRGRFVGELGRDTYKGMNASLGDLDNNGYADIYVSNVHHKLQAEGSLLWMNRGELTRRGAKAFRDESVPRRALNENRFGWGAAFGDLNGDGRLDIVQANGMVDDSYDRRHESCPDYWYWNEKIALTGPDIHGYADRWADLRGRCIFPREANRVYLNDGTHFVDVAAQVGMGQAGTARAVAFADLDNRGTLDVVITHQMAPISLYRRAVGTHHWVGLDLQGNGRDCNRDALGTRVQIEYGASSHPLTQWREVTAVNGFSSQGDRRLLFGLGEYSGALFANVYWCGAPDAQRVALSRNAYTHLVQP